MGREACKTVGKASVIPVAVIGMACRLPGEINSPDLLWDALLRGDDLVTEIPAERWDADYYYDPEPGVPGRSVCEWGSFLENVGDFDPDFFGISEREAIAMDPQHRLLLETAWEAMEHAGLTRHTIAADTGVFVGLNYGDYQFVHIATDAFDGPYGNTGTIACMASGRIAHALGLLGPAVTVDTACSSGLFAIHQACRSLNDRESQLAFAGGVNVMLEPRRSASGSAAGMLSATGRCHAFDAKADGFVSGEGCVVLLLKRLPDALHDGDRILGVIRSTATNHSEIFHEHYTLNKVQLRHLADLALLGARHEEAINWDELDRRFSAAGFGEVLATYLHLASELLGQSAPRRSHAPRQDALADLRNTESRDGIHSDRAPANHM